MGKDADCCESCRRFGGDAVVPVVAATPVLEAPRASVRIVVRERGGEAYEVVPTKAEVMVGRVQGNDVVLPKGNISKRQLVFRFAGDRVVVADMKSTCGTYVDGRKITSEVELREGSVVYAGDFELRVVRR